MQFAADLKNRFFSALDLFDVFWFRKFLHLVSFSLMKFRKIVASPAYFISIELWTPFYLALDSTLNGQFWKILNFTCIGIVNAMFGTFWAVLAVTLLSEMKILISNVVLSATALLLTLQNLGAEQTKNLFSCNCALSGKLKMCFLTPDSFYSHDPYFLLFFGFSWGLWVILFVEKDLEPVGPWEVLLESFIPWTQVLVSYFSLDVDFEKNHHVILKTDHLCFGLSFFFFILPPPISAFVLLMVMELETPGKFLEGSLQLLKGKCSWTLNLCAYFYIVTRNATLIPMEKEPAR